MCELTCRIGRGQLPKLSAIRGQGADRSKWEQDDIDKIKSAYKKQWELELDSCRQSVIGSR